jgi:aromatic ring-opening dioxygenase catalytic subunit (LigB family)
MMLINPSANIPILQMSILSSESPREHFAYGRALAKLRSQNIAIIGSGFASLHNLRQMFNGNIRRPEFKTLNVEWSKQVTEAAQTESLEERGRKFEQWRSFKGAYDMHPREDPDHFLPLIVCAGAGGEGKAKAYADEFMGLDMWSYYWE